MRITLSTDEVNQAKALGQLRQDESVKAGRTPAYGHSKDPVKALASHILGAAGELVVAKALAVPFVPHVNTFDRYGDVNGWEVRTRELKGRAEWEYELNIRPNDRHDRKFILVVGKMPTFVVKGWVWGSDGERLGRWDNLGNGRVYAWWVPQRFLYSLSTLKEA